MRLGLEPGTSLRVFGEDLGPRNKPQLVLVELLGTAVPRQGDQQIELRPAEVRPSLDDRGAYAEFLGLPADTVWAIKPGGQRVAVTSPGSVLEVDLR